MRKVFNDLTEIRYDGGLFEYPGMKEGRHRHSLTGSKDLNILLVTGGEVVEKKLCKKVELFQLVKKIWYKVAPLY